MAGAPTILVAAACGFLPLEAVELGRREVRVADLVSLDCIEAVERPRVGALVVATLPGDGRPATLSRAAVADLVRRRVPALANLSTETMGQSVSFRSSAQTAAPRTPICYAAAHAIETDEPLTRADVVAAACILNSERANLRYDRLHGAVRASEHLIAGEYLGPLAALPGVFPDADDALILSAAIGPVRIERDVVAVQPSLGEAIFVRDRDGDVFRAEVASLRAAQAVP